MPHGDAKSGLSMATPATLMLAGAGVAFSTHEFQQHSMERGFGKLAAQALGVEPERVFKTLLAEVEGLASSKIVVGIVPVSGHLSLKELAHAIGAKRAELCDPKLAERITGYVVGGISPFGQKRLLPTVIDETCDLFDTVYVSGGKRGFDIEIAPDDLVRVLAAKRAPIAVG